MKSTKCKKMQKLKIYPVQHFSEKQKNGSPRTTDRVGAVQLS